MRRRFVVLGGAGTIGKIVVRDLFESHPNNHIIIADYKQSAAEAISKSLKSRRVQAVFADATRPKKLAALLKGNSVVINCLQHDFNMQVMQAALSARVHYIDLGGLFHWTRKQLQLNKKFSDAGLLAVIGMGCSPGITNILASYGASWQPKVHSIKIRVGSVDFNPPTNRLRLPYSAQTIIEELTLQPWIFKNGGFRKMPPRRGWELTPFPKPLGKTWTLWTRHSEVATLPISFRKKGLRYCDFKVSFDPKFVKKLLYYMSLGWGIAQFSKFVTPDPNPNDYEISRVIVNDLVIDCHARAKPEWQASAGDIDTGCPPSIVAQMITDGLIYERGVLPPEIAVPFQPFFSELEKRGMQIKVTSKSSRRH